MVITTALTRTAATLRALPYVAAVVLDGVENVRIADCLFTNLDGIAIELLGYSRRVQILGNDFEFLGASAIVLWGRSSTALDESGTLSSSITLRRMVEFDSLAETCGGFCREAAASIHVSPTRTR